jgi:hypothetical protein
MIAYAESDVLHARVRAHIEAFEQGREPPEPFDVLAVDLARYQARHIAGHARLCAARGVDPSRFRSAADAPAVPTEAFKLAHVFAFPPTEARFSFRTSGTTAGARGTHPMRDARTYDAAALAFGRALLFAGSSSPQVVVVGPSPSEAPDSSLAHMCGLFARSLGHAPPGVETWFVREGTLDAGGLRRRVAGLPPGSSVVLLATSFALVHLLDALDGERLPLPPGSRVMQTGGYKGRSREVAPGELRASVARTFGVDERAVVGEYGMTELSSQFWEATAASPGARPGVYVEPPWARVVAVDPSTLAPVQEGETGIARIEDLANVDSAMAIVTQDRVRRVPGGFELRGRSPGASPRGCSIAVDEMLGGPGTAS